MPSFAAVDHPKDIECSVCLDVWIDPVECVPCRHVFCRNCISSLRICPECRRKVEKFEPPNRILLNMANEVTVECESCKWRGKREQSRSHVCGPAVSPPPNAAPAPLPLQRHPAAPQSPIRPVRYDIHAAQQPHPPAAPPARIAPIPLTGSRPWETYGIEQQEYDQIMAIFMTFDTDDSGSLDKSELRKLARWLNFCHSDADVDRMFAQMDTDRSGTLTLEEFLTWLKYNKPDPQALYGLSQMEYNTVLMSFHEYDSDGNGMLSLNEFKQLCTRNGYARSPDEAANIFRAIDTDGNGTVDLHEFLTYRARSSAGQGSRSRAASMNQAPAPMMMPAQPAQYNSYQLPAYSPQPPPPPPQPQPPGYFPPGPPGAFGAPYGQQQPQGGGVPNYYQQPPYAQQQQQQYPAQAGVYVSQQQYPPTPQNHGGGGGGGRSSNSDQKECSSM